MDVSGVIKVAMICVATSYAIDKLASTWIITVDKVFTPSLSISDAETANARKIERNSRALVSGAVSGFANGTLPSIGSPAWWWSFIWWTRPPQHSTTQPFKSETVTETMVPGPEPGPAQI